LNAVAGQLRDDRVLVLRYRLGRALAAAISEAARRGVEAQPPFC